MPSPWSSDSTQDSTSKAGGPYYFHHLQVGNYSDCLKFMKIIWTSGRAVKETKSDIV